MNPQITHVKTTMDGRRVEVIDGQLCLAGVPETTVLVPLSEHPNRQAIARVMPDAAYVAGRLPLTLSEAATAQGALTQAQRRFDASPSGINQRIRRALWAKAAADGVE